jgi:hypothetical protein
LSVARRIVERMFEDMEWPEEWEPIPGSELASLGPWDIPNEPGGVVEVPAGLDDFVHEAQRAPLGPDTLALLLATLLRQQPRRGREQHREGVRTQRCPLRLMHEIVQTRRGCCRRRVAVGGWRS